MEEKDEITFRSITSPIGVISGVALGKDGGIIASFKLGLGRDTFYIRGKPHSSVILTIVCKRRGVKVYDIFDKILSKYSGDDMKSQTGNTDRIRCCWRISKDIVKRAFEEVEEKLEKRSWKK